MAGRRRMTTLMGLQPVGSGRSAAAGGGGRELVVVAVVVVGGETVVVGGMGTDAGERGEAWDAVKSVCLCL